ncbi:LysR family transcriptional regulator [Paracoccus sp. MBLB3053]|uniref:LysR family transcriptional regulator n=1 Tax=Paracoccus aurantius TaxID=3073814 RepID=A0ABU2HWU4_9RHOB|nr:LysR family transcriptional regulator [Paracoccus sp. MBLB3053]MDS9469513.1 LysR family transcriptional regulator [Paracoccus sp. MBLB3053]
MGELESIRIFLEVASQRSFSGAARALGLAPAAVTRAVAALETKLGTQLLVRTTRAVSLTAAGALYAARVAPLADGLGAAAEEMRERQGELSGLLRISAPLSLGSLVLPSVLSQFATIHPRTNVLVSLTDRLVDIVSEDLDLAIRISGAPSDKSTIWRKICRVPRLLVASPSYLNRQGTPETPEDLAAHDCLGYASGMAGETWNLSRGDEQRHIRASGRFQANNGELLAQLAANGEGIVMLPHFMLREALGNRSLVPVLPDWHPSELWLTLYYPPYERLPLRVATFSDFFESHVRESWKD